MIGHRGPLRQPSEPEDHYTNRPDKSKTPDIAWGERYLKKLSLANIRDIIKMVRWNDKFGIKFMRLDSGMCPFASHAEYGYNLEPFAAGVLAEAGKVIAELGHRVATRPGQVCFALACLSGAELSYANNPNSTLSSVPPRRRSSPPQSVTWSTTMICSPC